MFDICDERTDDMMHIRRFMAAAQKAGAYSYRYAALTPEPNRHTSPVNQPGKTPQAG